MAAGDVVEEVVVEAADDANGVVVADGMLWVVDAASAIGVVDADVVVDASGVEVTVAGLLRSVGAVMR